MNRKRKYEGGSELPSALPTPQAVTTHKSTHKKKKNVRAFSAPARRGSNQGASRQTAPTSRISAKQADGGAFAARTSNSRNLDEIASPRASRPEKQSKPRHDDDDEYHNMDTISFRSSSPVSSIRDPAEDCGKVLSQMSTPAQLTGSSKGAYNDHFFGTPDAAGTRTSCQKYTPNAAKPLAEALAERPAYAHSLPLSQQPYASDSARVFATVFTFGEGLLSVGTTPAFYYNSADLDNHKPASSKKSHASSSMSSQSCAAPRNISSSLKPNQYVLPMSPGPITHKKGKVPVSPTFTHKPLRPGNYVVESESHRYRMGANTIENTPPSSPNRCVFPHSLPGTPKLEIGAGRWYGTPREDINLGLSSYSPSIFHMPASPGSLLSSGVRRNRVLKPRTCDSLLCTEEMDDDIFHTFPPVRKFFAMFSLCMRADFRTCHSREYDDLVSMVRGELCLHALFTSSSCLPITCSRQCFEYMYIQGKHKDTTFQLECMCGQTQNCTKRQAQKHTSFVLNSVLMFRSPKRDTLMDSA
jgi:hypothetical protein